MASLEASDSSRKQELSKASTSKSRDIFSTNKKSKKKDKRGNVDVGYSERRYERMRPDQQYVLTNKIVNKVKEAEQKILPSSKKNRRPWNYDVEAVESSISDKTEGTSELQSFMLDSSGMSQSK